MKLFTLLSCTVLAMLGATQVTADTYYRMQGSQCKSISENAPSGDSGVGKYRVTSNASLSGVVCPIATHRSLNGPKRIIVLTSGIEASNASFIGCSATGGTQIASHSRNYINIAGNNLTNLTCILGQYDSIDWVYWVEG